MLEARWQRRADEWRTEAKQLRILVQHTLEQGSRAARWNVWSWSLLVVDSSLVVVSMPLCLLRRSS